MYDVVITLERNTGFWSNSDFFLPKLLSFVIQTCSERYLPRPTRAIGRHLALVVMTVRLNDLPTEVLFQILLWAPPASIPAFQQVCRKFNDLSQPLLWRHHCRTQFKYWTPKHDITGKLRQNVASVDWKRIFRERHVADIEIDHELEGILTSQTCRLDRSEKIVAYGYDAKDTLLRHLDVSEDAEDVLARRSGPTICTRYSIGR